MATTPLSLFQTQEQNRTHLGSDPSRLGSTTTSQRGRKPNGGKNQAKKKKKIPQRGMGVAQLEMLRLQELREAQVENSLIINPTPTQPHQVPNNNNNNNNNFNFLPFPTPQQATTFQYYCNMGYNGGGLGSGRVVSNPFGPFNVGGVAVPHDNNNNHVFETSTELTSIPKMMVKYPDLMKKWIDGEKQGYFGRRDNLGQTFPYHGRDFHGFNQENNPYFNAQMGGFSARAARSAFYANHNSNEGLEGVPINSWKGNSVGEGIDLMEHDFFPGKNGRSTNPKEMEFGSEASVAVGGEAKSCLTTSDYSGCSASNASSYVDLSLKLSY